MRFTKKLVAKIMFFVVIGWFSLSAFLFTITMITPMGEKFGDVGRKVNGQVLLHSEVAAAKVGAATALAVMPCCLGVPTMLALSCLYLAAE